MWWGRTAARGPTAPESPARCSVGRRLTTRAQAGHRFRKMQVFRGRRTIEDQEVCIPSRAELEVVCTVRRSVRRLTAHAMLPRYARARPTFALGTLGYCVNGPALGRSLKNEAASNERASSLRQPAKSRTALHRTVRLMRRT